MTTRTEGHIDFLDLFRGVAILMVFLFHSMGASFSLENLPWDGLVRDYSYSKSILALLPLTYGRMGVALFFVISGFCIHLSFEKHRASGFRPFFIRRFWRIFPPYLLALLLFALLFPSSRISPDAPGWTDLFIHALGIHNFFDASFYSINPSFWSIAVEIQVYLLYPVLLALASRYGWSRTVLALALLEGTLRSLTGLAIIAEVSLPRALTDSPLSYWWSWSLGAWLADAWLKGKAPPLARFSPWWWALAAAITYQIRPLEPLTFPFTALLTFAVVARLLGRRPVTTGRNGLLWTHMRQAGVWSYSLYLLHQPVLMLIPSLKARWITDVAVHPLVTFAACMLLWPALVGLSWAFYRGVEVPSIAIGKRFLPRRQS